MSKLPLFPSVNLFSASGGVDSHQKGARDIIQSSLCDAGFLLRPESNTPARSVAAPGKRAAATRGGLDLCPAVLQLPLPGPNVS